MLIFRGTSNLLFPFSFLYLDESIKEKSIKNLRINFKNIDTTKVLEQVDKFATTQKNSKLLIPEIAPFENNYSKNFIIIF